MVEQGKFEMFFHYGEYELAWEAVTSVAQRTPPDPACWALLAEAAMLIRKYERFDNYFMSLVRRAVDNSTDLRGAIKSLQSHVQDADDHVDANELVSRLAEV